MAGALQPLDDMNDVLKKYAKKSIDDVKAANVEGSVKAATYDDKFYAFPMTANLQLIFPLLEMDSKDLQKQSQRGMLL